MRCKKERKRRERGWWLGVFQALVKKDTVWEFWKWEALLAKKKSFF